jgi:arylsulfatase A-like enzyme
MKITKLNKRAIKSLSSLCLLVALQVTMVLSARGAERPNVLFIICDDLNDYIEGFGGHPQTKTPHMARLARSGVCFTQAHCNIPICGPSRASLFSGIYPHNSGCFGFTKWDGYEILKNSRTIMDHFRANGYRTLGTGKLMHHMVRGEWEVFGNPSDYGPFAHDGKDKIAHPMVPSPYREIGAVDGSFGPLVNLVGKKSPGGNPLTWQTGGWARQRELKVNTQADRDLTADELNGKWAVDQLKVLAKHKGRKPFFMGVGFIRPHTPLVVPKKFFEMFPLGDINLPDIRKGDVEDTHARSVRSIPGGAEPKAARTEDMGTRLFRLLVESYKSREDALRHFIQAYLASIAAVDEQIGRILDVIDNSPLKENTIIVLTSDHGWGMGEKDYLYKNSLWQESTRVPLILRAPGTGKPSGVVTRPVSLIDIYPTLIDLCGLDEKTMKNDKGRPLDGHSLKPLLEKPAQGKWSGPDSALTALYKWRMKYNPSQESYSLRSDNWRYIRYENGKEELYATREDSHEWVNLAGNPSHSATLISMRRQLRKRVPSPESNIPPQPAFKPRVVATKKPPAKSDAEAWKDKYFKRYPQADTNKDGTLTWPEYKAHKSALDALQSGGTKPKIKP